MPTPRPTNSAPDPCGHKLPAVKASRALEQHIAVFGESGSGKTVLLSSFYGATQEAAFMRDALVHIVADDIGQGSKLYRNYLGMKDSDQAPAPTRFAADTYTFSVKLKDPGPPEKGAKPVDTLRLVWHDYPGEWFEQGVSGAEEARRRVATFRSLLVSDVALLLVDGQRLIDNAGEEERYLKSLFSNLRNGLLSLKSDLLENGERLVEFPRIWILALSKADLLPELDVYGFRDLLIATAGDDIDELRKVLAGLIDSDDALSVGEDFVLLSSAKFEPNRIEVSERVGVDLMLPMASILPLERHVRWIDQKKAGARLSESMVDGVADLASAFFGVTGSRVAKIGRLVGKFDRRIGRVMDVIGVDSLGGLIDSVSTLAGDKLKARNAEALAKQDHMASMLIGYRMDLDRGEADGVLLRSHR